MSEDDICARCSPSKLDPAGPAYQKMKNSKKFDPAKSAVLEVDTSKNITTTTKILSVSR